MSGLTKEANARGGRASKKRDLVTQMLVIELNAIDPATGLKKARMLAEKLVSKALEGDTTAAREVLDRVEGKAVQINENHNFAHRAADLSDDELAGIISEGGCDGAVAPPLDPSQLN